MSLKNIMYLTAVMASAGMSGNPSIGGFEQRFPTEEEKNRKKRESMLKKGYKEFWIEDEYILALSEKRAKDKFNKLKRDKSK